MNESRDVINFAERVMALLDQGKFTSTYKYAVLLALMDLSMERFSKKGIAPSMVTTRQLAEKIIEIYWPHTVPFNISKSGERVLLQNSGRKNVQATIIKKIQSFRETSKVGAMAPYFKAKFSDQMQFEKLIHDVEWVLIQMPLPRLQKFGSGVSEFIYQINWDDSIKKGEVSQYQKGDSASLFDNRILFHRNVAAYLIQLNSLLRPLIQREWSVQVASLNKLEESKLQSFLFGTPRAATTGLRNDLMDIQQGCCFYCVGKFGASMSKKPEVDHFIPWARYPNDCLANYVVAHRDCNANKKDFLVSEDHLGAWWSRVCTDSSFVSDISSIAQKKSWEPGIELSKGVATSIYLNLENGVELWQERNKFTSANKNRIYQILNYESGF